MKTEATLPLACKSARDQRAMKEAAERIQQIRKEVERDSRLLAKYCLVDGGVQKK